jgi:hypothetical protein
MNTYTDPALLDVRGALDALPELPLHGEPSDTRNAAKSTGTDDLLLSTLAPLLAPTADFSSKSQSIPGNGADNGVEQPERLAIAASVESVSESERLTGAVKGKVGFGATRHRQNFSSEASGR